MKTYRGSRHIALLIINFGARWRCIVNFMLQALDPWEGTLVNIGVEAGWAPGRVQMYLEVRKLSLTGPIA
jgi:hypothetical protein